MRSQTYRFAFPVGCALSPRLDQPAELTADGKTRDFWERNLRFKTDVSDDGPQSGAPAIVGAGMVGDRADVIFSSPEEITGFIGNRC